MNKKPKNIILVIIIGSMSIVVLLFFNQLINLSYSSMLFYDDNSIVLEISKELTKNGIKHKIKGQGTIFYKPDDEKNVTQIVLKIENRFYNMPATLFFPKEEIQSIFLDLLEKNNIPYKKIKHCCPTKFGVTWPNEYDAQVKKIERDFYKLLNYKYDDIKSLL